jgi:hypothetical protein
MRHGADPAPAGTRMTLIYTFQATAAIHLDWILGPGSNPLDLAQEVVAYQGDGANRSFDDSDRIDGASSRMDLVLEVTLSLTNGRVTGIGTKVLRAVAGASHQLRPFFKTGRNVLDFTKAEGLDGRRAAVYFTAHCSNSLATGSWLMPVDLKCAIHFSLTGAYGGMQGTASGYPWIQLRGFHGGRLIDNLKLVPESRCNFLRLATRRAFQSGVWRQEGLRP